jgi:hypothetical protein
MGQTELQTFQLNSPLQLLIKLAWGIKQLKAAIGSTDMPGSFYPAVYTAFDCTITAWQMSDWVYEFYSGKVELPLSQDLKYSKSEKLRKFQGWVCEQSPYLRICMHIANSNKHFGVSRHPDPGLKVTIDWNVESQMSAGMSVGGRLVDRSYRLMVTDGGISHEILHILCNAHDFWADQIKEPSLIGLYDQDV